MTTTALPRPAELTALPHSGLSVPEFYSMHFMAALVPMTAGLLLYGYRAAVAIMLVGLGTAGGVAIWRRIGSRGRQLSYPHALWLALLLAMMLPAQLASTQIPGVEQTPWYLLPAAGLLLTIFLWILGGLAGRVHPVLVTYLIIATLFVQLLVPHWVLQRNHLFVGDVLKGQPSDIRTAETDPGRTAIKSAARTRNIPSPPANRSPTSPPAAGAAVASDPKPAARPNAAAGRSDYRRTSRPHRLRAVPSPSSWADCSFSIAA